jgi:hypothetical protein
MSRKFVSRTQAQLTCDNDGQFFLKHSGDSWLAVFLGKFVDREKAENVGGLNYCPVCAEPLVDAIVDDEFRKGCSTHGEFVVRIVNHTPAIVYIMEHW